MLFSCLYVFEYFTELLGGVKDGPLLVIGQAVVEHHVLYNFGATLPSSTQHYSAVFSIFHYDGFPTQRGWSRQATLSVTWLKNLNNQVG